MSVALYIVAQKQPKNLDVFVNGKSLGHADEKAIDRLCKKLKVRPLLDFCSQDPEELADFIAEEGGQVPEELPAEQWFEAAEGLATVRALLEHLAKNPEALKNAKAIITDLKEFEAVLARLEKRKIHWHLAVDF